MHRSVTLGAAITDVAGDIFRRSSTVSFIVQEIAMRRLRLLHDERRSRKVGHEVGSFVRSLEAVSSLTEALIGAKVIYGSNTRQTRALIFIHESGRTGPTHLIKENQLAASRCEFVSRMPRIYKCEKCNRAHINSNYCR